MGDPISGIKYCALFACIAVLLYMMLLLARGYRITFGKIKMFPSSIEAILQILIAIMNIIVIVCLLWSAIAWVVS